MTNKSNDFGPGTCVICGKAPYAPYRRIVDGVIVEGCIGEAHTGHLPIGNSRAWHDRPSAKKHRASAKAWEKANYGRACATVRA